MTDIDLTLKIKTIMHLGGFGYRATVVRVFGAPEEEHRTPEFYHRTWRRCNIDDNDALVFINVTIVQNLGSPGYIKGSRNASTVVYIDGLESLYVVCVMDGQTGEDLAMTRGKL